MSQELSRYLQTQQDNLVSVMRISCAVVSTKVVEGTPRRTGSARASWNASKGTPKVRNIVINAENPSQTRNNITSVTNSLQPGETFTLANGLPYIRPLEYGSSQQARNGMLRVAIAEWDEIVSDAISGNRS